MNKTAQQQIVSDFYNAGVQLALSGGGMEKNARVSLNALRQALSGGTAQSADVSRAIAERLSGQAGTAFGGLGGLGAYMKMTGESPGLALAGLPVGAAMTLGGAGLGNVIGRNVGGGLGSIEGYLSGLAPFRATGNFLADPFRRVPGIRG